MRVTRPSIASVLLVASALACERAPQVSGPRTVEVYGENLATHVYAAQPVQIQSLTSLNEVRGAAANFRTNATVVVSAELSDVASSATLTEQGGDPADAQFAEQAGVDRALDYDSLTQISSYWTLERSRDFYIELGVDAGALRSLPTYYLPRVQLLTGILPTVFLYTDNAAYDPTTDSFLLLPPLESPGIPLFVNQGVMTHEYGHKVFNHVVERDLRGGLSALPTWSVASAHQLDGLNEGLSDLFGATVTADPDFIRASLPAVSPSRNLALIREMTEEDARVALGLSSDGTPLTGFDPHALGAFVASALWSEGELIGNHRAVAQTVLAAEDRMSERYAANPNADFGMAIFFDEFLAALPPSFIAQSCELLQARLGALFALDTQHPLTECQ